jgi:protease I
MKLKNKNIAFLIADLYEDLEFWYPYLRLKEEGAYTQIIGKERGKYQGKNCLPAEADIGIGEASPEDYDALVIPGGYAPDHLRRTKEMIDFVGKMHNHGKIIAAICHAGWVLASAGIISDKKVTSFFSIKDDLVNAGADWMDREVVVDENIITSRNPGDLPAFCRAIIEEVSQAD